jgi:hypothetical protein
MDVFTIKHGFNKGNIALIIRRENLDQLRVTHLIFSFRRPAVGEINTAIGTLIKTFPIFTFAFWAKHFHSFKRHTGTEQKTSF